MRRGRGYALLAGLVVWAMVGALACGGEKKEPTRPGPAVAERTPETTTGAYTPAPKDQQVFTIAMTAQPVYLDPHKSQFAQDIAIERLLYRPLFWLDEKGNAIAAVAKEIPTQQNGGISADGKTVRVTIKDNQKWSDGSPLTAKDFEYSFKRAVHPKLASPYAEELFNIVGAKAYYESKSSDPAELARLRDEIAVKAIDDKTLEVKLINPQPTFVFKWGLWIAYPVKQSAVERGGAPIENTEWAIQPGRQIGNGPFVLKEYREKDRIVLEANPNYSLEPKPKLSRVEVRIIEDEETAFNAFQTGEVMYAAVPPSKVPLVDSDPNLKRLNIRGPDPTVFWLQFQHEVPVLKNQKVRLAIAKAIDRQAFVKAVLAGIGEPTTLFMHTSLPGQNPSDGDVLTYDPARAKQLLAEAGYPNGQGFPRLNFLSSSTTVAKASAEFIQKQLKDNLNIDINLEIVDTRTRSARYSASQFELALGGWHEDYHDPENWLPTLMATGATNNQLKYSNPRFDELVRQAQFELNNEKRLQLYAQANKVLLEDAAVAPIYQRVRNAVVASKVKNLVPHSQDSGWAGNMLIERIEIARE